MRGKSLICMSIVLMLVVTLAATNVGFSQPTRIYVDPATSTAIPGTAFNVTVKIENSPAIVGWQFILRFDKAVLEFPPTVTEGSFLSNVGSTSLQVVSSPLESYVHVGCHLTAAGTASGNGDLAILTFNVLDSGVSNLTLLEGTIYNGGIVDVDTSDGYFYTAKPFVDFDWTPYPAPEVNEVCTFNASACWDPDGGTINQYSWDFGDSNTTVTTSPVITHKYAGYNESGWLVNLTVTDDEADTWSKAQTLIMWHEVITVDMWPSIVDNSNPWWWFDTVDHTFDWEDQLWILVTTVNLGTYTEEITVTLYADKDDSVIGDEWKMHWVWWDGLDFVPGSINTVGPHAGSGWNLPFLVDLCYLPAGTWTITAVADPVPGEVNTANNNLTKQFTLTAPAPYAMGDINFDHTVDMVDIVSAVIGDGSWRMAFGSVPGMEVIYSEPAWWWVWHWKADINKDKIIDICDLVSIAINFGNTW